VEVVQVSERKTPKALAAYAVERHERRQALITDKLQSAEDQLDAMAQAITKVVLKHPYLENAPDDLIEQLRELRGIMVKASSSLEFAKRLIQQKE
jgi:hypothetical protein